METIFFDSFQVKSMKEKNPVAHKSGPSKRNTGFKIFEMI